MGFAVMHLSVVFYVLFCGTASVMSTTPVKKSQQSQLKMGEPEYFPEQPKPKVKKSVKHTPLTKMQRLALLQPVAEYFEDDNATNKKDSKDKKALQGVLLEVSSEVSVMEEEDNFMSAELVPDLEYAKKNLAAGEKMVGLQIDSAEKTHIVNSVKDVSMIELEPGAAGLDTTPYDTHEFGAPVTPAQAIAMGQPMGALRPPMMAPAGNLVGIINAPVAPPAPFNLPLIPYLPPSDAEPMLATGAAEPAAA